MKRITLNGICEDFVHAFLHYHKIPIEQLALKFTNRQNVISNQSLIDVITYHFRVFENSQKSLDAYFNRQIVKVYLQSNKQKSVLQNLELSNVPLFMIFDNKNKWLVYGETKITSKKPVKMPVDKLKSFLGITEVNLTFENCPRNVDMYKVERNTCFTDFSTPGSLNNDIAIGLDGENYYWIPDKSIVEKRYFCRKFPNQCNVFFKTKQNLDRHVAVCEVETKIISKQVWFYHELLCSAYNNSSVLFLPIPI